MVLEERKLLAASSERNTLHFLHSSLWFTRKQAEYIYNTDPVYNTHFALKLHSIELKSAGRGYLIFTSNF